MNNKTAFSFGFSDPTSNYKCGVIGCTHVPSPKKHYHCQYASRVNGCMCTFDSLEEKEKHSNDYSIHTMYIHNFVFNCK